ncbi:winged helix-turn-helix domain-containing tetratricopeptide repeat protein [Paludibaculum fermentans]|uniref:winged helix-turn-helix domain-containing tetratricopeptide repeat protein n=1 Tax=Paludibaculum fermentans TaxID=1473598 RepID=UPI003EBA026C
MPAISGRVAFGDFDLDLTTGELRKSGSVLKLEPQPASVLSLLVSEAGRLVGREEIRRRLWGDSTFVDYDSGVDYCVNRIRSVLCDHARAPRYIETLRGRGYRFIALVGVEKAFAEPTLAVLPFANLNGDPEREYFADGMTDALITELARIPAVRVISRQSVLHLKGSNRKLDEIARDLRVDGVVEGAALHGRSRVRVNAQLILMEPERHAWAHSYECDISTALMTQREVARAIAECVALALQSTGPVMPPPSPTPPMEPEIVENYLKAVSELYKASAESIGKALQYIRRVTIEAPDFALGHALHAACLFSLGWFGNAPAAEVFPGAKQMARRAVALDDSLSAAHHILATLNWVLDWDPATAEREFRRAIELSPSNVDAHLLYAAFLSGAARHAESIAEVQFALRIDPSSLFPHQMAGWVYLHACHYSEAAAQAKRTIESYPDALQPHFVLGWAAWRRGRTEEALAAFEKALSLSREAMSLAFLGHIYARLDRGQETQRFLLELDQLLSQGRASPMAFVILYAGLGDLDAAFDWLEAACRNRADMVWLTSGFPGIDPLRADPRFPELAGRTGIALSQLAGGQNWGPAVSRHKPRMMRCES